MVCIARFRNLIARSPIQLLPKFRDLALDHASGNRLIFFPNNRRCFRAAIAAMMLDFGAATEPGTVAVGGGGGLGGNDSVHDGGCVSGGWKRWHFVSFLSLSFDFFKKKKMEFICSICVIWIEFWVWVYNCLNACAMRWWIGMVFFIWRNCFGFVQSTDFCRYFGSEGWGIHLGSLDNEDWHLNWSSFL